MLTFLSTLKTTSLLCRKMPGHFLLDTSWCALHCEDSFFCSQHSLIAWSPLCGEAAWLPVSCVLSSWLGSHLSNTSWVQPQIPGRGKLHDPLTLRSFCLLFTFFFDNKSHDLFMACSFITCFYYPLLSLTFSFHTSFLLFFLTPCLGEEESENEKDYSI